MMNFESSLHCQNCGTLSDPQKTLAGISACVSCGLNRLESAFSMSEDLSKLFEQSMTFTQSPLPTASQHREQQPQETPSPEVRPAIGYSASQHYVSSTRPVMSPDSCRIQQDEQLPLACEQLLLQHGISPRHLQSDQKSLFLYATPDQRKRLIELWTVCNQSKSVELQPNTSMGQDALGVNTHDENVDVAEPYIRNGYEDIKQDSFSKQTVSPLGSAVGNRNGYRQAIGPMFRNISQGWCVPDHNAITGQPTEFQYGIFEAMRQYDVPIEDSEML